MAFETVRVDSEEHLGTIVLDRPGEMNTFNTQMATELDDALLELEEKQAVRAIVIRGAGDAFSAGIDISEHDEHDTQQEYEQWVSRMEEPFLTLAEMGTPVIAAAHGHAAANGLGLVAACDLAVLAEGTKLGATAPKVGLFCMGPAVPIMRSVTEKRCLELLLTGELIDAKTALEWGLANRVTPEDTLEEKARELAGSITDKSPVAIRRGKRTYYETADMPYEEALRYSNEQFGKLCTTEDAAEGIDAFLSGREPDW